MSEKLKFEDDKKTVNTMGINIDIASIIGTQIAEQWLGSLDEEHMEVMINFLTDEYFEVKKYDWQDIKLKTAKVQYGKQYPIDMVKQVFGEKTKEALINRVDEIIQSKNYKEEIDKIANELIDYAINGYKEDLKKELRQRLVNNVLAPTPEYGNESLITIINKIIDYRFKM